MTEIQMTETGFGILNICPAPFVHYLMLLVGFSLKPFDNEQKVRGVSDFDIRISNLIFLADGNFTKLVDNHTSIYFYFKVIE